MLIEILVKDLIEEGRELLKALERAKFPVTAAFWERLPDAGYWQLVIASELARENGPIKAYTTLQAIWNTVKPSSVRFTDITLLSPTDPSYIRYLKYLPYRRGSNPRDMAVEDGYIYFVNPGETLQKIGNSVSALED